MKAFFTSLLISCSVLTYAQGPVNYFFNRDGGRVQSRDSAAYIRTVTPPEAGTKLYSYKETTLEGKVFREGYSLKPDYVQADVRCTTYYPSGKMLSDITYDHARRKTETYYFPNGKTYLVINYNFITPNPADPKHFTTDTLITTCNNIAGKALVSNGNGHFIKYIAPLTDDYIAYLNLTDVYYTGHELGFTEDGFVKNGKKTGQWKGKNKDGAYSYTETYTNGKFLEGQSISNTGEVLKYNQLHQSPEYAGGIDQFYDFLSKNIVYPKEDRDKGIRGKVFITYIVEKDGSTSKWQILRGISDGTSAECIRVVKLSTWAPGRLHGIPIREQYTVPISFDLN